MSPPATIGVVDDDPGMLKALHRLLASEGYAVRTFDSADAFLRRPPEATVDCLLLDVSLPGLTGLELQEQLGRFGDRLPIVFLTGQGDIPMTVRALKAGAINFLTKPANDTELLDAVREAVAQAASLRAHDEGLTDDRTRLARLTPRELEVLRHVIAGKPNKQIAADLGTSEQTIKVHRMRVTSKLRLASVAELVRAADRLGIPPAA